MSKKTENADDFLRIHEGIMKPCLTSSPRRIAYVSLIGVASMLLLGELLDLSGVLGIYSRQISTNLVIPAISLLIVANTLINSSLSWFTSWSRHLNSRL